MKFKEYPWTIPEVLPPAPLNLTFAHNNKNTNLNDKYRYSTSLRSIPLHLAPIFTLFFYMSFTLYELHNIKE